MIDETSGIIGWPIGQQYKELAVRNEASTTTWETLVEQYRERAARDDARIDELRQSTEHWHDTAQMLKRQRDTAEEERDGWKERALKAVQERQVNRDLFIIAEGQRDEWKIRAIKVEQERQALWDKCEALRKDAARYRWLKPQLEMDWDVGNPVYLSLSLTVEVPTHVEVSFDLDATIDAALAVQPTTGEGDE